MAPHEVPVHSGRLPPDVPDSCAAQHEDALFVEQAGQLLAAVRERYGHDFSLYAPASLHRRIRSFLKTQNAASPAAVVPRLLRDEPFFRSFLAALSVPVTEMFRDPQVFRFLREKVLPMLATYPHVRIWQAGCATGKEVYSLAILLHEEGLAGRFRIYATDMNDAALETARQGIYPVSEMREYAENYLKSGGRATLSDYYHARYESVIFDGKLRESVLFANHNLVTDGPFNEMHLILCRNVLIYFSRPLQDRVLGLLHASLVPRGFLCLGTKESLRFSSVVEHFEMVDSRTKIFRLRP